MHINKVLTHVKAQESSPKAFKIGKPPERPGALPPDLRRGIAPGTHQGP